MSTGQRRTRDLIAVALFVALLAFLFWPSGDDSEDGPDAAPDGVAEIETATPEPEATQPPVAADRVLACEPGDAARVVNSWIAALNNGDTERLAEMLPAAGAESPTTTSFPGMDQTILHSFRVHESEAMASPEDVIEYLEARHQDYSERWRIDDLELQRLGRSIEGDAVELDRATVLISRFADDLPDHELQGIIIINCYEHQLLLVDLISEDPELALPISVDQFLGAVGPYGTGEMRDLRMIVSTDLREDTGALMQWDLRRIEANSMSGTYVEAIQVHTMNGNEILNYVFDGTRWYLNHRGWHEVGDLTGWSVLPLEIMMTRLEPSVTADILRDHLDEIPEEGSVTLSGEFEIRDELSQAAALVPRAEAVEGIVEVEVEDGNLVRTSYRLVDRQLGVHSNVPEIRWLHIHRRDRYDPSVFARPPGFTPDEQQYVPAPGLDGQIELIERLDHEEGIGERFSLEWDGEQYELLITPSRGFSHENTRGDDWPMTWDRQMIVAGGQRVMLAGPGDSILPSSAIWDTRQYRYDLRIDPDTFNEPDRWSQRTVTEIVEALLAAETRTDGLRWLGP